MPMRVRPEKGLFSVERGVSGGLGPPRGALISSSLRLFDPSVIHLRRADELTPASEIFHRAVADGNVGVATDSDFLMR